MLIVSSIDFYILATITNCWHWSLVDQIYPIEPQFMTVDQLITHLTDAQNLL